MYDKRISQEVNGDDIGEQFKGYIFKITGGNDKQGFPMKQGILTNTRIRLMMGKSKLRIREQFVDSQQTLLATDPEEPVKGRESLFVDALLELISLWFIW